MLGSESNSGGVAHLCGRWIPLAGGDCIVIILVGTQVVRQPVAHIDMEANYGIENLQILTSCPRYIIELRSF
jgi:hypothetical protein